MLERVAKLIQGMERMESEAKAAMSELEAAVEMDDGPRIEKARHRMHDNLDVRMDLLTEAHKYKQSRFEEMVKKFGKL